MWLHNNSYQNQKRERDNVLRRKFPCARSRKQTEEVFGNTLVHNPKSIHDTHRGGIAKFFYQGPKPKWNEQHGEENNENSLNQIGPVGGRESAKNPVHNNNGGDHGNDDIFQFHASDLFDTHEGGGERSYRRQHGREVVHVENHSKNRVSRAESPGLVAFHEPIPEGKVTHSSIPNGGDPVDWRDEKPHER